MAQPVRHRHRWLTPTLIVVGVLTIAVGLWAARTVYLLAENLREIVSSEFSARTGGTVRVADLSWNWRYLEFTSVEADAPMLPGAVHLPTVRVHVRLRAAMARDLLAAVDRIELASPTVVVDRSIVERAKQWRDQPPVDDVGPIPRMEIVVDDGTVLWREEGTDSTVAVATGISGWVSVSDDVVLNVSGSLLSGEVNAAARGVIPLNGGRPEVELSAVHVDLRRFDLAAVGSAEGRADLSVSLNEEVTARLALTGAEFITRDDIRIGPITTEVAIDGNAASWTQTDLPIGGLILSTVGCVTWGDEPFIDAQARWSGDVDRLGNLVSDRLAELRGNVRGRIDVSGPLKSPSIVFDAMSDSLRAGRLILSRIGLRGHTEPMADGQDSPQLTLDTFGATFGNDRIDGTGSATLSPLDVALRLRPARIRLASHESLADAEITGSVVVSGEARLRPSGSTASLRISDVDARISGRSPPLRSITATYDSSGMLSLAGHGPGLVLAAIVDEDSLLGARLTGSLDISDYSLPLGDPPAGARGALAFSADASGLQLGGDVILQPHNRDAFPVSVQVESRFSEPGSTTVRLATTSLPYSVLRLDANAVLTLENGSWSVQGWAWRGALQFGGRIGGARDFAALIRVHRAPVEELSGVIRMDKFMTAGTVSGRLRIESTPTRGLSGSGDFTISDMTMKQVDSLQASASINITPAEVSWKSGPVTRNGRTMAFTSGSYAIRNRVASIDIWGPPDGRIEHGLALGGVSLNASGDALWSVGIVDTTGDVHPARLDIEVLATDGELLTIPFDTTQIRLNGNTHWLDLEYAYLSKHRFYTAAADVGRVPVAPPDGGEFDIPIHVRDEPGNDVLWLLTRLIDQGVDGNGSGQAYIRVAGPSSEVVIGEGWVQIDDGTLRWPGGIWPEWQQLTGRAAIAPGERFIRLENLSASVGTGFVTVSNTPASGMGATALTIPAIGASLGTLQIETPEPIPLHVRGGMPEGESLDIDLSGNEVVERFTIAGPWEHPLFVGSSTLSNGFFTYPLEGASDSDTLDADGGSFVENVNWQVDLVSGPNLTYETRSTQTLWRGLMRDPIELLGSMAAEMEARLSEGGRVELRGIYADSSLSIITDNLVSDQGRMSVLDIDFRPDGPLVLDWDTRADPEPLIRGRGVAEVEIDQDAYGEPDAGSGSLSRERQYQKIYARLVSVDPLTGVVREGGRLGELRVELDTDASRQGPVGERQQLAVLRMLGYHAPVLGEQDYDPAESQSIDPKDIVTAGYRTLLRRSEQQAWRSLFYPFRRQIRKLTRIDVVEVEPSFVLNLLDRDTYSRQELTPEQAYLTYLQGTNWTVGEYVWGRFLLSYHGELELTSIARPTIGARHEIGVEWAISPQTRLELSRDIDVPIGEPDTRIGLSHRFAFQSY